MNESKTRPRLGSQLHEKLAIGGHSWVFIRSQMVTVIEHGRQSQPKFLEALSLNSVSPGQAAPAGAVRSGPTP